MSELEENKNKEITFANVKRGDIIYAYWCFKTNKGKIHQHYGAGYTITEIYKDKNMVTKLKLETDELHEFLHITEQMQNSTLIFHDNGFYSTKDLSEDEIEKYIQYYKDDIK